MDSILSESSKNISSQKEPDLIVTTKDKKDFELLYDSYSPTLFNIILKLLKKESLAEEVLQYSFLKMWLRFDEYNSRKQNLFTWMVGIVKASATNKIRFQKHIEALMCLKAVDSGSEEADNKSRESALNNDPEKLLNLIFFECYTPQQIAEELGVPLSVIQCQLREGLKNFRKDRYSTQP